MTEKHSKKVIVQDELSTASARAERLKRVRNLANLNRKAMCCTEDLNINTYKGWEIARYGGLPIDGAKKVIKRVTDCGVICNLEWLLYGKGDEPYIIPQSSHNASSNNESENDLILREIMLFQSLHTNSIYHKLVDDGLEPKIAQHDYVAGIRYFDKQLQQCIGLDCIIQTQTGEILTRQLKQNKKPGTYMLVCTNPETQVDKPVLYDIHVESAAPILRIYKPHSTPWSSD